MTDFIEVLEKKHKESIARIKLLIDVSAQKYPEYRAAATLCKFIYDSEDRYAMLHEPDMFSGFYDNAQVFEQLCDSVYHSLTDDGEISFVKINDHFPVIIFDNRWELNQDSLIPETEKAMYERLNAFKKEKGMLPLHETKIVFLDDVYSYIEAVEQHRKNYEIQVKRFEEWKRLNKRLENREKPNLTEVEFGTPHLKEE